MRKSTDVKSLYKNNTMCRQYSVLENGVVDAVVPPLVVADTDADTLDAAKAKNDAIITALADVEALEAARQVAEPDAETPRTVTVTDVDGNESTEPQAEWAAYDAAQATISDASNLTNDFETVRKGKPSETLPVMKTIEETITDEEGNETTRSVEVVDDEAKPTANPAFAEWQAAWSPVNEALN
tara:strand:+ start:1217 stop:1768 length:552 start_codon:yes stop_codon:yes gene_type:complete